MIEEVSHLNMSTTRLGAVIKGARQRKKWTQAELGRRVGMSRAWVTHMEGGRIDSVPEPKLLDALERELGVERSALEQAAGYGAGDLGNPLEEERLAVALVKQIMRRAPDDGRIALLGVLENFELFTRPGEVSDAHEE